MPGPGPLMLGGLALLVLASFVLVWLFSDNRGSD